MSCGLMVVAWVATSFLTVIMLVCLYAKSRSWLPSTLEHCLVAVVNLAINPFEENYCTKSRRPQSGSKNLQIWLKESHLKQNFQLFRVPTVTFLAFIYTWTFQRVLKWFLKVSIHHALSFNWHPQLKKLVNVEPPIWKKIPLSQLGFILFVRFPPEFKG